jgi:hypothetical protein
VSVQAREVAARKRIWEQLHPETRHGGDHRSSVAKRHLKKELDVPRFTAATARAMGVGETKVKQLAALGAKATSALLGAVDAGAVTRREAAKLAALPPKKQEAEVRRRGAEADAGDRGAAREGRAARKDPPHALAATGGAGAVRARDAPRLGVEAAELLAFELRRPRLRLLDAARRGDRDGVTEALRRLGLG